MRVNDLLCKINGESNFKFEFFYPMKMQLFSFAISSIGSLYASYYLLNPSNENLDKHYKIFMSLIAFGCSFFLILSIIHIFFDKLVANKFLIFDKENLYLVNVFMLRRFVKIPINEINNIVFLGRENIVARGQCILRIYVCNSIFPYQFTELNFKESKIINQINDILLELIKK